MQPVRGPADAGNTPLVLRTIQRGNPAGPANLLSRMPHEASRAIEGIEGAFPKVGSANSRSGAWVGGGNPSRQQGPSERFGRRRSIVRGVSLVMKDENGLRFAHQLTCRCTRGFATRGKASHNEHTLTVNQRFTHRGVTTVIHR
jgi:hypothetical protein